MNIVKYRKVFYSISAFLVIASIGAVIYWGLNFGVDFKGGSILEVSYQNARPEMSVLQDVISNQKLGETSIRPTGDKGYIIRTKALSEPERASFVSALGVSEGFQIKRFDSVGPILGKELQAKAGLSIVIVILAIVLFITFAFRKVSEPVSSFKYGLVAIVALVHDVIVPTGVFAILGHYQGIEVDALFVTALLVVLGFSVHDTIVVFDRVRENLRLSKGHKPFEQVVGESINQTFVRSINTSLTVLLSLVILYFFGPEATHNFSLALFVGITAGTYSSIFLGSPLLVTLQKLQDRKKK
ncbi:MAG: protein translocase subunit SecF [Candidatus Paceibacterota bacterium]|jgi:preprotein translocase subunit SecF